MDRTPMTSVEIITIPEYEISEDVISQLRDLQEGGFPGIYEGRIYFKQTPHFRLLAKEGGHVVGQVGIDSRVINVGGTVLSIFGVIDLAVQSNRRGQGIGTKLLSQAEELARRSRRDFLMAMADRHDLYLKQGYRRVQPASVRWLAIEKLQSIKVIERDLSDCFMAIDMLGYLF